jgi:UDP-N-acetylglucosamine--N-acetylmuramyl-(pentapeptide) pyrophosphoryl-undecaprenol N-acetylglucosamine transferase
MKVVIAGGGTAGHVNPALALAEALGDEVSFVGTSKGAEARLVPGAGRPLSMLEVRGFDRSRPWAFPAVALRAVRATQQARRILSEQRPAVVVGMGGYVSLPVGLAARSKRIPLVLHEQNIVLGLANKVLCRFADAVAVSFEDTLTDVGSRGEYVGNPVPSRLVHFDRDAARAAGARRFDLDPEKPTLLVFGGSLGAKTINEAADGLRAAWRDRPDRQVLHISGSAQPQLDSDAGALAFRSVPYVEDMTEAYALADLALCRGGATTVAEITVARVPAIIVPYPYHRDRQQERHAQVLERAGAGVSLPDNEASAQRVAELADALLADPDRLRAMSTAAGGLARPDAASALAGVVRRVAT